MMSVQTRKLSGRKCRSSISHCQEKYACCGVNTEAEFRCEECNTLQCGACESQLHQVSKFVFHDRKRLLLPPQQKLCQFSCQDRNFADLNCENCDIRFCFHCFDKVHVQGKRKQHKTTVVVDEPVVCDSNKRAPGNAVETHKLDKHRPMLSEQLFSADFDAVCIKPTSPISPGDDSLTYYSVPQMEAGGNLQTSSNSDSSKKSLPDIAVDIGLAMNQDCIGSPVENLDETMSESFLLIDSEETVQIASIDEFVSKLKCKKKDKLKTISIFGNTGDGKSHTLNHTFFGGREVFKTSPEQESCTVGVWCAYDPKTESIILDTEGLLGVTSNANKRTRLLLKVLAVSDIIIYRSRAERIHNDMFRFLADASKAYLKHFTAELREISKKLSCELLPVSNLGPVVIVFHQTANTNVLGNAKDKNAAVKILKEKFQEQKLTIDAFSGLAYVGVKAANQETCVRDLRLEINRQLGNNSVRSPRTPGVLFSALKALNDKFCGDIEKTLPSTFPDQYFRCRVHCRSCKMQCTLTMNHLEHEQHRIDQRCEYRDEFENQVYYCKSCYNRGANEVVVPKTSSAKDGSWLGLAKYAWAGYVLECRKCGIIYRSRQYWYGNDEPVRAAVKTEIKHVWPEGNPVLGGTHNAARRLLDGFQYVADVVSGPTSTMNKWVADQIRPDYWRPNSEIHECRNCQCSFGDTRITIHHCRACGEGFCDDCSAKHLPVPERGWGDEAVRVCDSCYEQRTSKEDSNGSQAGDPTQVRARKVGEIITNTLGAVVGPAVNYPLGVIRDSARPTYWVPDNEIQACDVCKTDFGPKITIHHCRACGQGVCDPCSPHRLEVPSRGWDHRVRVCNKCAQTQDNL